MDIRCLLTRIRGMIIPERLILQNNVMCQFITRQEER